MNAVQPGAMLLDRISHLGLRFSRVFGVGRSRLKGMADLDNRLNSSSVQAVNASYWYHWRHLVEADADSAGAVESVLRSVEFLRR